MTAAVYTPSASPTPELAFALSTVDSTSPYGYNQHLQVPRDVAVPQRGRLSRRQEGKGSDPRSTARAHPAKRTESTI